MSAEMKENRREVGRFNKKGVRSQNRGKRGEMKRERKHKEERGVKK